MEAAAIGGSTRLAAGQYRRERDYIDDLRGEDNAAEAAEALFEGREPESEY